MIYYIGAGSNLGDRSAMVEAALKKMAGLDEVKLLRRSAVYETESFGKKDQPDFLNLVAEIESGLSPRDLLFSLKSLELEMGRGQQEPRWSSRLIDLDILLCSDFILKAQGLELPHPEMHKRFFVLKPLSDLAPDFIHPVFRKSISVLLGDLPDQGRWRKVEDEISLSRS